MDQDTQRSKKFSGFLDEGTSFEGQLSFEGTVRVDGLLSGSVTTRDVLIVGPSAVVRADVTAGGLQIHGRVVGDVQCAGRVEICSGGQLQGDVYSPHLVIEDGGRFDGRSETTSGGARVAPAPVEPVLAPDTPDPDETDREESADPPRSAFLQMSRWKILDRWTAPDSTAATLTGEAADEE